MAKSELIREVAALRAEVEQLRRELDLLAASVAQARDTGPTVTPKASVSRRAPAKRAPEPKPEPKRASPTRRTPLPEMPQVRLASDLVETISGVRDDGTRIVVPSQEPPPVLVRGRDIDV